MRKYDLKRIKRVLSEIDKLTESAKIEKANKKYFWDFANVVWQVNRSFKISEDEEGVFFTIDIEEGPINFDTKNYLKRSQQQTVFVLVMVYLTLKYRFNKIVSLKPKEISDEIVEKIDEILEDVSKIKLDKRKHLKKWQVIEIVRGFNAGLQDPEWGVRLKNEEIDDIYRNIYVEDDKYVVYKDYRTGLIKKIPIDSPEIAYAVSQTYAELYIKTIPFLKERSKGGQWCPLREWQIINEVVRIPIIKYLLYY